MYPIGVECSELHMIDSQIRDFGRDEQFMEAGAQFQSIQWLTRNQRLIPDNAHSIIILS